MKHITCDKCGMPTEKEDDIVINNYKYDMCQSCINEIMRGLSMKGVHVNPYPKQIFEKYKYPPNPNDNKFLCKD